MPQGIGILERAVDHQFGIDTAVGGIIDVFKEDSEKSWRNCMTRFIDLNGNLRFFPLLSVKQR